MDFSRYIELFIICALIATWFVTMCGRVWDDSKAMQERYTLYSMNEKTVAALSEALKELQRQKTVVVTRDDNGLLTVQALATSTVQGILDELEASRLARENQEVKHDGK